ncbi:hypothetical protein PCASD_07166 [Puccinia coronata f. sp. avenae]|uniref:Uncharacterized protein n=1 Tax=Puccinia coronata f. sp. avenae TaxID=200324 RepID=A0A2N5UUX1_9BASI|nr:hypothetical protein PCASD_07166 [Puccinia coronata f. sp. avenae]
MDQVIDDYKKKNRQLCEAVENLAQMAASEFLLDAAIRFKLGRAPPSESLTDSNSVAKRPGPLSLNGSAIHSVARA